MARGLHVNIMIVLEMSNSYNLRATKNVVTSKKQYKQKRPHVEFEIHQTCFSLDSLEKHGIWNRSK